MRSQANNGARNRGNPDNVSCVVADVVGAA